MTSATEPPYTIRKRRRPDGTYQVDTRATVRDRSRPIGFVAEGSTQELAWMAYPPTGPVNAGHPTRDEAAAWLYARWLQR